MASTEQAKPKERIRRPVSPEIAALVREEVATLQATISTAQAAVNAAQATVAAAETKCKAALRPIVTQLGIAEGDVIGWEGFGTDTVLILDVPAPTEG